MPGVLYAPGARVMLAGRCYEAVAANLSMIPTIFQSPPTWRLVEPISTGLNPIAVGNPEVACAPRGAPAREEG